MAASGKNNNITAEIQSLFANTKEFNNFLRTCMLQLLGSCAPGEADEAVWVLVATILVNRGYTAPDGKKPVPDGIWPPQNMEPFQAMAFHHALSGRKPWHVDVVITEGLATRHFIIYVTVPQGETMFGVEVEEQQPLTGRVKHYSRLWRLV